MKTIQFQLSSRDREYVTTNIAMLMKAGVPVVSIFDSLSQSSRSFKMKKALEQMKDNVENGMALWQVMQKGGVVSDQTIAFVRLGEESGNLVENLEVAAEQERKRRNLIAKVRSAMLYPAFVVSLTIIVGIGVSWFILPRLAQVFRELRIELPFISQVLVNIGSFLQEHGGWAVPVFLLVCVILGYVLFGASKTKHLGRSILLHIPGVGQLMREVEIAQFGYLLGTLLRSGLPITESFALLQKVAYTTEFRKMYEHLYKRFDEGYGFRDGFSRFELSSALLPLPIQQMIITGERSGSLPEALTLIGDNYEQKADVSAKDLETILEPILLVIVWFGVLAIAVAVILPIYSLIGGLQG